MLCTPVSHVCHRSRLSRKSVRTEIEECSNKAISHKKCALCWSIPSISVRTDLRLKRDLWQGALSTRPGPWALTILGISGTKKRKKKWIFSPSSSHTAALRCKPPLLRWPGHAFGSALLEHSLHFGSNGFAT